MTEPKPIDDVLSLDFFPPCGCFSGEDKAEAKETNRAMMYTMANDLGTNLVNIMRSEGLCSAAAPYVLALLVESALTGVVQCQVGLETGVSPESNAKFADLLCGHHEVLLDRLRAVHERSMSILANTARTH